MPEQILGPLGALALAVAVILGMGRALLLLWTEHQRDDRRTEDALERMTSLTEAYAQTFPELAATVHEAMDVVKERRAASRPAPAGRRSRDDD